MDGTIVDKNSNIIPQTVSALKAARAQGHLTMIATGRPYSDIVRDLDKNLFDYLIANNGAYYHNVETNKSTYGNAVPSSMVEETIKIGTEFKCMFAVHTETTAIRASLMGDVDLSEGPYEEWMKFDLTSLDELKEMIKDQKLMQVSLRGTKDDIKAIEPLFDKYKDEVDIHIANDVYLDINPKGVSKLYGIKNVLKEIDRDLKDVIAFGDSGNDLDMLQGCGVGVCMGNGNEKAKEVSDVVIGDNNTTAIADKVLEMI